ncbi:hypothetical protein TorRG33x02_237110 [Trema orientale]|uniref:Uncharacterized protein n=1 Tax=Trema orientale TaxID=63057 RepID=A0A2P5E010_TREOI|nr:hypothetical protein TorRG33x02_237110 [Trema orientale]
MASGAAEMTMLCSISMQDMEIEWWPYHRNCGCALHNLNGTSSNGCLHDHRSVSFPKKQSWSNSSLTINQASTSSKFSSQNSLLIVMSTKNSEDIINGTLSHS